MNYLEGNWKPIDGYGGDYWISDSGQVVSTKQAGSRGFRTITPRSTDFGYQLVLHHEGKKRYHQIHILVAVTFGVAEVGDRVVHLDGDKKNNHVSNLLGETYDYLDYESALSAINKLSGVELCIEEHPPHLVEWRPVPGYENRYWASSCGQVASVGFGSARVLKQNQNPGGYYFVRLRKEKGVSQYLSVHRVVALSFGKANQDDECVRHLDDNRVDNHATNLAGGTRQENILDAVRNGVHPMSSKTKCKRGHPFSRENTYVRPDGGRDCRECIKIRSQKYKMQQQEQKETEV